MINSIRNLYLSDSFSLYSVSVFVGAWLILGNVWSIIFTFNPIVINQSLIILYLVVYFIIIIPVIIAFFKEFLSIENKFKYVILIELLMFVPFIIAPPRNADAMRVWLARVYDIWMNSEKTIRPYFHYNTPDAFSLFHLPVIDIGDGQFFQLSIFISLCSVIILLIKICKNYCEDDFVVMCVMLFLFNPLIILGSTVIITDLPTILSVSGFVYSLILYGQGRKNIGIFLIALFLAFGLNIKYNIIMFIPVLVYWFITELRFLKINGKIVLYLLPLIILAVYPYVTNYINIGNPVWPALTQYFPAHNPLWDKMANNISQGFLGSERSFTNLISSLLGLLVMPHHINPLTMILLFFVFKKYRYVNYMPAVIVVSYVMILWLMMPNFAESEKERYILYLFPVIIPFGLSYVNELVTKNIKYIKIKKYIKYCVLTSVLIYLPFTVVYSYDAIKYLVTYDKENWHRATWYYEDYQWISKNIVLNDENVILVISHVQQTYYLRKKYINGGAFSAYIDWNNIDSSLVVPLLQRYKIQYIFVDISVASSKIRDIFSNLKKQNLLKILKKSDTYISSFRMMRKGADHKTILYQVVASENDE